MTERTASGRTRRKRSARTPKSREVSPLVHLGPVTWACAMLMASVALAAAAVFTHRLP